MGRIGRLRAQVAERNAVEEKEEEMTRKRGEQPLKEQTDRKKGVREELRQQIREEVSGRLSLSDEELYDMIDRLIMEREAREYLPLKERIELRTALFNSFRRLDILQQLIDDPDVTEVMINGPEHIFIEKKGVMKLWEQEFESQEQLEDMIQQMVSRVNRTVNVASPIADARLPDGSRVHVVLPPVSLDGPAVTIRKFPRRITMDMLIASGTVSREAADFLKKLVRSGYNIFISGGTNSGKTTFLNALSAFIPQDERVITIEDSAELQIQQVKNLIRLETRTANPQGEGAITIGDLIRASLRMNPSRIIVGEVRGKEALELLNSYNTGHDGGMSSGHGNSPRDMLARLETMVLMGADLPLAAIRSQIASALDILIHLGRIQDKSRKVLWIVEVDDYAEGEIRLRTLYRFEDGGLKKKEQLKNREKLQRSGEST